MSEEQQELNLWSEVQNNLDYMVSVREYLHQNPELSTQEFETSAFVYKELEKLGVDDLRMIADTGVTGLIKGDLPGPVMLLRADMDALPIEESNELPYKSKKSGVMHACGHDGHTASLLGTAKILSENKDKLKGTVRLAFQPAEEGEGGAKRMIEAGILENPKVDYAFAFHVYGVLQEGQIGIRSGGLWASCDDINIEFIGKGGHGSQPYLCVNPIQMGMDVLQRMNQYLAQSCKGSLGSVLSFGQFTSGTAVNIIPDRAQLKGTLRTYDIESRKLILEKLEQSLKHAAEFYGGDYVLDAQLFAPPCHNDPELTERVSSLLQKHGNPDLLVFMKESLTGSEDFAFFSQEVPSFFFMLGIRDDEDVTWHTPEFHWNSKVLQYSSLNMLNIVYYLTEFKNNN